MPTYHCQIPNDSLSAEQKSKLAAAIAYRHSEATGAPIHFVQVVIDDSPHRIRYLGTAQASGHIWIRGDIRAGRSKETRERLIQNIAMDTSQIANVPIDEVWVYVCNLEPTDMIEYGHVLPAPGKEQEWFDNLPAPIKKKLLELGQSDHFTL